MSTLHLPDDFIVLHAESSMQCLFAGACPVGRHCYATTSWCFGGHSTQGQHHRSQ